MTAFMILLYRALISCRPIPEGHKLATKLARWLTKIGTWTFNAR